MESEISKILLAQWPFYPEKKVKEICTLFSTVYGAMFNPMIHESGFVVISLHWRKKDAEMAMGFHRVEYHKENGIDNYTAWRVYKFKIN